MATRSSISVSFPLENKIKTVYCHWDGYPSYNGKLLKTHYNSFEKAKELVEMGDISSLNESIENTKFFKRDRQEVDVDARTYTDINEMLDQENQEYDYIFINDGWFLTDGEEFFEIDINQD